MPLLIDNKKDRGILIVDDEPNITNMMQEVLEASGYNKIFTAHDGVEALSILSANGENIYVTVLDIVMPRMSGTAVIKHLSNIHAFPVGIIIISGYSSREDIKDILNQNVGNIFTTNFIGKPFQVNDIIQDVEKALDYIHEKRKKQLSLSVEEIQNQITEFKENTNIDLLAIVNNEIKLLREEIKNELKSLTADSKTIKDKLDNISKKQYNFLSQLGLDVLRIILIALAVIALLYLGIGNLISSIINNIP